MPLDAEQIRKDFPLLSREENGQAVAYLDSTNTSQTPNQVVQAMTKYYEQHNANVHRAIYKVGEEADAMYEAAREKVRGFINAENTKEIIWTRNATEAINLLAWTWGWKNLKKSDTVLLSQMEHHSNIVPWLQLQEVVGFEISYIPISDDYRLDMDAYFDLLETKKVKLVAVTGMSNVLGTVTPLQQICDLAHDNNAYVMVDSAQLVAHGPVNVTEIDCDFMAFTGHKMLGPTGIGVLYAKEELMTDAPAFMGGGDMIRTVEFDKWTANDLPWKFEAGTPNIAGAIGLGAAVDYLSDLGMENVAAYEKELMEYAMEKLSEVRGLTLYGPASNDDRGAVFSFNLDEIHAHDTAQVLSDQGVCVRAGHHCAQPLMGLLGVAATARASLYLYNTKEEVDRLVEGLEKVKDIFT